MIMMKKILFLSTPAKGSGSFGMMKKLLLGAAFSLAMVAAKASGNTIYYVTDADTGLPITNYPLNFRFTYGVFGYQTSAVTGSPYTFSYSGPLSGSSVCGYVYTSDPCVKIIGDPNSCLTGGNHYIQLKGVKPQLIIRDAVSDAGIQPNPSTDIWTSPDLWNRRDNNGSPNDNQDPGYGGGSNLMKVRIKNIGCATSSLSHVRLYWTLGKTGEHWPASWDGTEKLGNPAIPAGGEIKSNDPAYNVWGNNGYDIEPLAPGAETVIRAKWVVQNPNAYNLGDVKEGSMICFLGRIDDPTNEPMFNEVSSSTASTGNNIRNNNNIATRNSKFINLSGVFKVVPGGGILVNNYFPERIAFNVRFRALTANDAKFVDVGRIRLTMSERLWNAWTEGGRMAEGVEISNEEAHEVEVRDLAGVVLKNIAIEPDEHMGINPSFELITNNGDLETYNFAFSQEKAERTEDEEAYGSECVFIVTVNGEEQTNEGGTFERQSTARRSQAAGEAAGAEAGLLLYPNPSNDMVTISFAASAKDKTVNVRITDMSGKLVQQSAEKVNYQKSSSSIIINTKAIKSGVYIVSLQAEGSTQSAQLRVLHQ
jgi:hypothetical protein